MQIYSMVVTKIQANVLSEKIVEIKKQLQYDRVRT